MSGCAAFAFFAAATSARRRFSSSSSADLSASSAESFSSRSRSSASSRLELLDGLLRERRGLRAARSASKASPGAGFAPARVGAGEPVADVEQLAHRRQRVELAGSGRWLWTAWLPSVLDDPRLAEHRLARRRLEGRLVDQRAQVVLVGQPQRRRRDL